MSSSSSDDENDGAPDFCQLEAEEIMRNLLPDKSKLRYVKTYEEFNNWRAENGITYLSECVLLSYFNMLAKKYKPPSLWCFYSMLKATINTNHDVKINKYSKLTAFLRKQSAGYKSKKAKVFSSQEIQNFLKNAPDEKFLATKVALIMGVCGACRTQELKNLTPDDITMADNDNIIVVNLRNTKTNVDRSFVITDKDFVDIIRRYQEKRPTGYAKNDFFLGFRNGQCVRQTMGKNKLTAVPKEVATYLNLPNPELYTGHSLRRTSATILADTGANITSIKRLGGWKSTTVAEGYIEESIENKTKICNKITESIKNEEPKPGPSKLPKVTHDEDNVSLSQNIIQTVHMPGQPASQHFHNCSNITIINYNK